MLSNLWRESVSRLLVITLFGMLGPALMAQTAAKSALTGRVTDASGSAVANATVTATSIEIGQMQSATTGPDGTYKLDLAPGNYRVKLEATGFKTVEIPSVTVRGAETAVPDEKLELEEQSAGKPTSAQQDNLPNAPSSSTTAPSLSDLGLSPEQTRGNPQEQALLDKRTHMLKIHQRMGLITTIPLIHLLPCFRTKLSMICAKERGRGYVEEQAHGSADDRGAEASGGGTESGRCGARGGRVQAHALRLEGEVRWHGREPGAGSEAAAG